MAGGHKHKWTWIVKYKPEHFGEKGFLPPTSRKIKALNLNQISNIAEKLARSGQGQKEGDRIVVDIVSLGYDKVLGGGRLTYPVKIIAKSWTRSAEEKITASNSLIVAAG